jgi:hypothetical protein
MKTYRLQDYVAKGKEIFVGLEDSNGKGSFCSPQSQANHLRPWGNIVQSAPRLGRADSILTNCC